MILDPSSSPGPMLPLFFREIFLHAGYRSFFRLVAGFFALAMALLQTGCGSLPSGGPSGSRLTMAADQTRDEEDPDPYQLIPITRKVDTILAAEEAAGSESGLSTLAAPEIMNSKVEKLFRTEGISRLPAPPDQSISAGDQLDITIFTVGGGVFGPLGPGQTSSTSTGTLPPQLVDQSGQITVPFVGRVQAAGLSPYQIEEEIVAGLKPKSIDPHVIVTLMARKGGDLVTITGDVRTPTIVPVSLAGTHLLDALTIAGGSLGEPHETAVTVIRGSRARTENLGAIFADIKKNILLQPGDTVIVRRHPWSYIVSGAIANKTVIGPWENVPFVQPDINLAQAIATAGGPLDTRANPTVYLYRQEPTRFVEQLGLKPVISIAGTTPVIYKLDLRNPRSFFLAGKFSMRDQDIIYFPDAGSVGVTKFFDVINALTSPVRSAGSTATGAAGF